RPALAPSRGALHASAPSQTLPAAPRSLRIGVPGGDEFAPMRRAGGGELLARKRQLSRVLCRGQRPAQQLEAQVDEVGSHHVGFAVTADLVDLARLESRVDFAAVHAQLAGKAAKARDRIQAGARPRL